MIKLLMKKYVLSRKGSKDLIKGTLACVFQNIALMLPVSLLYFLVSDLIAGGIPTSHYWIYIVGIVVAFAIIYTSSKIMYKATYFATYKESSVRRITLAEKLRTLPLSFFGERDLSDLTSTIMGDCATLETAFSHWVPELFGSIISTIIISIGLFFFDWRLALAALWVLPVSLAIVFFSKKIQNYFSKKQMNAKMACADSIQECIETVRDLKSNNAEEMYLDGLNKKIDNVEKRAIKSELGLAMFVMPAGMLLKLGIATVALVGGLLIKNDSISLLTFFMFLLVVSRLYDPLISSIQNLAAVISTQININRMREIEEFPIQSGESDFSSNGYDIEFKNVCFSYNTGETVLDNVSFSAKQGQVTALIGPSGGGKSTVAKLAARFWDANKGTITVGGTKINTIDPEKLLSIYAIVFQDVTLFNNTVIENIRIGKKDATDEEVLNAAKQAQCDEFVAKLSDGYNTMIGENGLLLSGGERQRISIARAILKDAPIVLLDEATASLDAENETIVQKALSGLVKEKTVLIIAHRMRTIECADKIVVLENGKVIESGTPKALKKNNGVYAKMLSLQQRK